MRRAKLTVLALILTVLLAAACEGLFVTPVSTGHSVECDDLVDERALSFSFDPMSPEEAEAWVIHTFGTTTSDNSPESMYRLLNWTSEKHRWSMYLTERETTLGAYWEYDRPALREVLRCMGAPDYYRAFLDSTPGPTLTQLELWYPRDGLRFFVTLTEPVSKFDSAVAIKGVSYFKPGTVQEIMRPIAVEPSSAQYRRLLNSVKPWPGSLDEVEVDPPLDKQEP